MTDGPQPTPIPPPAPAVGGGLPVAAIGLMLAGLLVGVIAIALAVSGFVRLSGSVASMPRMGVPGQLEFDAKAGIYTIFVETRSVIDGTPTTGPQRIPGLTAEALDAQGNNLTLTAGPNVEASYAFGSYEGASVAAFEVVQDGRVTVKAVRNDVPVTGTPVIAWAKAGEVVGGIFGAVCSVCVGGPLALALIVGGIVMFVTRRG